MGTWKTSSPEAWTFSKGLIAGYGRGIGDFNSSYAIEEGQGEILNGRVSAQLRLIRRRGVGAGLVCRADRRWNFLSFYTAPEDASSEETFARFGVYEEGLLTNIATAETPITLGIGFNMFSLEFYSGQLTGQIETENASSTLSVNCPYFPFPGFVGLVRLYASGVIAQSFSTHQATIPFTASNIPSAKPFADSEFDVFLCHSSDDKEIVRNIAKQLADSGITYWLDEERIAYGNRITERIEEGLQRSRFVVPCISMNLGRSGWSRAEYGAILNAELSGNLEQSVVPLVLDESDGRNVPLLLRDKRRAFYINKTEFQHFLQFLKNSRYQ